MDYSIHHRALTTNYYLIILVYEKVFRKAKTLKIFFPSYTIHKRENLETELSQQEVFEPMRLEETPPSPSFEKERESSKSRAVAAAARTPFLRL